MLGIELWTSSVKVVGCSLDGAVVAIGFFCQMHGCLMR
jgi:hypothetical protein